MSDRSEFSLEAPSGDRIYFTQTNPVSAVGPIDVFETRIVKRTARQIRVQALPTPAPLLSRIVAGRDDVSGECGGLVWGVTRRAMLERLHDSAAAYEYRCRVMLARAEAGLRAVEAMLAEEAP